MYLKRGDVVYIELDNKGNIQTGYRPCVIVSNNKCNRFSPVVLVVPLTSSCKSVLPTHVPIRLVEQSTALCEQVIPINTTDIGKKIHSVSSEEMARIDNALKISLDLN